MSRLKDEVIEDTSKLGEIIEHCKEEVKHYDSYGDVGEVDSFDDGIMEGRKEFADSILKLLGLLKE
tara:strand:- start:29 stop:226 length:198 start_codon:yes stop_codon:yes gene_type:complete